MAECVLCFILVHERLNHEFITVMVFNYVRQP